MDQIPQRFWTVITICLAILGAWGVSQLPGIDPSTKSLIIGLLLGGGAALPAKPVGAPGSVVPSVENPPKKPVD